MDPDKGKKKKKHHHHHHHRHHHHHHHHYPPPDMPSLGDQNQQHFDAVAEEAFQIPWIIDLCNQITEELQANIDWIGLGPSGAYAGSSSTKMLDYACGNGVASRALAPYVDKVRGMDISSGMVNQYNQMAEYNGYTPHKMRAIQGDLLNSSSSSSSSAMNSSSFDNFDVIVMCMALHHVDDHDKMVKRLVKRLKPGGTLVVIDWVAVTESGCPSAAQAMELSNHTMARMGFEEKEVKRAYEKAGLEKWSWRWCSNRSVVPEEIGGVQQLFFARGRRPSR